MYMYFVKGPCSDAPTQPHPPPTFPHHRSRGIADGFSEKIMCKQLFDSCGNSRSCIEPSGPRVSSPHSCHSIGDEPRLGHGWGCTPYPGMTASTAAPESACRKRPRDAAIPNVSLTSGMSVINQLTWETELVDTSADALDASELKYAFAKALIQVHDAHLCFLVAEIRGVQAVIIAILFKKSSRLFGRGPA
jgi:hypothetical protein